MIWAGSIDDLRHGIEQYIDHTIKRNMKSVISGKGGVGKTTVCALLAKEAASKGYHVLAVDADPSPTLAATLGVCQEPTPLIEFRDLIEERLGSLEGFLRLNPKVDDIPERFAMEKDGVKILVMGSIQKGGEGCACPQNTFLKSLLQHIAFEREDWVFMDLEAGLEPLGRATVRGFDVLLVVVEPDSRSLITAGRIHKLAHDLGLRHIYAISNKIREAADVAFIEDRLPRGVTLLGALPFSEAIRRAGRDGSLPADPLVQQEIKRILEQLEASHGMERVSA